MSPNEPRQPIGLLLCDDMIFTSRITGTAKTLNLTITPARSAEALEGLARQQTPALVILDLGHFGLNIGELVRRLEETCSPRPFLVAYGSHVDTASLRQARGAGCDVVLPRSKFVEDLARALPQWLAGKVP